MRISLSNQRAFVSAGAAGIGLATCKALSQAGAEVITCDVDRQALDALPATIQGHYCDVSDANQVQELMAQVLKTRLDILVNNVGIAGPTAAIEDVTPEQWRYTLAVCIDAHFLFTRAVVPEFKRNQQGCIISLTSGAGLFGFPNRSPYVAAKWGITGLVKSLAMELGPHNIRVNGIAPGCVSGERMDRVIQAHAELEGKSEREIAHLYAMGTSMQCYVDPEEIAETIVFLCAHQGRHISGQIIGVDGHTETLIPRIP